MTYYGKHIYVELVVDTIKGNFIFDTGADELYIDDTFYADNNFKHKYVVAGTSHGVGTQAEKIKRFLILSLLVCRIKAIYRTILL